MARFGSLIEKDRKIYGNCQVLSPDGILMFRCDDKKLNWYLKRDLAELVEEDPKTIKLKFTPNGLGNHNKQYGLTVMENKCVCCGGIEFLTRHHVVPYCYRRYFPTEIKSHNFHDVLSLCVDCHEKYEVFSFEKKRELANIHSAPINGDIIDNKDIIRMRRIASGILFNSNIPDNRIREMKKEIKNFLGLKRLSFKKIKQLSDLDIPIYSKTHGEMVVAKIENLQEFIQMWREHFIENSNCKYLPDNWSTKNEFGK